MSIEYNCDMCKDNKTIDIKEFTSLTLQIRTPNWVNMQYHMQYHICPDCMEQLNIKELKMDTHSAGDRLLDILRDIVTEEVEEAVSNQ